MASADDRESPGVVVGQDQEQSIVTALAEIPRQRDDAVELDDGSYGCGGVEVVSGRVCGFGFNEHGEAVGICLGVNRILALHRRTRELTREASELSEQLQRSCADAERWQEETRELSQGLGALIDRQFAQWGLTRAEREIALLILKGFSHKEIAALRTVGEATVRQQATAIYRKSGVSNRQELSAFFLEDLLNGGGRLGRAGYAKVECRPDVNGVYQAPGTRRLDQRPNHDDIGPGAKCLAADESSCASRAPSACGTSRRARGSRTGRPTPRGST